MRRVRPPLDRVCRPSGFRISPITASGPAALVVNFLAGIPASRIALLRRSRVRTLAIATLLFFTPLAAYWPTTFHYYGMRDDYSKLREAHEDPSDLRRIDVVVDMRRLRRFRGEN